MTIQGKDNDHKIIFSVYRVGNSSIYRAKPGRVNAQQRRTIQLKCNIKNHFFNATIIDIISQQ